MKVSGDLPARPQPYVDNRETLPFMLIDDRFIMLRPNYAIAVS